jgi:hypothetical protein
MIYTRAGWWRCRRGEGRTGRARYANVWLGPRSRSAEYSMYVRRIEIEDLRSFVADYGDSLLGITVTVY